MTTPVRVRLTAWYVALLAATLGALAVFLVVSELTALERALDAVLASRAREVVLAATDGEANAADAKEAPLAGLPKVDSGAQLLSRQGAVLASSGVRAARLPMLTKSQIGRVAGGRPLAHTRTLNGTSFRYLAVPLNLRGGRRVLVVASSFEPVERAIGTLTVFVLIGAPSVLLVASLGGWVLAGHALRPVARMTAAAAEIDAEGLDRRVDVPAAADELRRLAETLNAMLDRVHAGIEDQRRFVANASHELRTPLAVMRTELDVELGRDDLPAEVRDVLVSTQEEARRMSGIVEDLLTLATMDEHRLALHCRPFDLTELASRVVEHRRAMAEREGVRIRLTGGSVLVDADPDRVEQAVGNLVDNAVAYVGPGGEVDVAVKQQAEAAEVSVSDTGPGIPADALPHIFDRFFRVDEPRSRDSGGSGLGLAICREIVRAQGGDVSATSDPSHGSVFTLSLPCGARGTP